MRLQKKYDPGSRPLYPQRPVPSSARALYRLWDAAADAGYHRGSSNAGATPERPRQGEAWALHPARAPGGADTPTALLRRVPMSTAPPKRREAEAGEGWRVPAGGGGLACATAGCGAGRQDHGCGDGELHPPRGASPRKRPTARSRSVPFLPSAVWGLCGEGTPGTAGGTWKGTQNQSRGAQSTRNRHRPVGAFGCMENKPGKNDLFSVII